LNGFRRSLTLMLCLCRRAFWAPERPRWYGDFVVENLWLMYLRTTLFSSMTVEQHSACEPWQAHCCDWERIWRYGVILLSGWLVAY
jgi:hypothetical protein